MIALPRGRVVLRTMPASCGIEEVTSADYSWNGLKRGLTPFAVIQHTLAGQGQLDYEGRRYPLAAGDTMLVGIPHGHKYFYAGGAPWRFFFLVVSGQEALRLLGEVRQAAGPVLRLSAPALERLAANVLALLDADSPAPGAASALAYAAVTTLVDDVLSVGGGAGEAQRPDWLRRVEAHIERQLQGPLSVDRLAPLAGMSRAHFVRQFARHAGIAPSEFVFRTRMARAARLLQSSGLTILEIAQACGYPDPNYFAKAFRRAFDVSPSEFRRSGLFTSPEPPRVAGS